MKCKRYLSLLLTSLLIGCLFTGCGAQSKSEAYDNAAAAEAPAEPMAENSSALTDSAAGSTALPENRKWIITVNMNAETSDLNAMLTALDQKIASLGGYVENQNIQNTARHHGANLTIRIPAESVDSFTQEVSGISNVTRNNKSLEDVTLSYVATESRINALQVEEARLLELLAQAENMSDLLEIEARLTDVRYELERVTSQLRLYDNQIDFATIYLNIEQVEIYTPVEEPTLWERMTGSFTGSLEAMYEGSQTLLVVIVGASPFLILYGAIALVIVIVIRSAKKRKKTPQPPKTKENQE